MADRVLRDELLDSERYLSLSSDTARLLFIHFILVADDFGNCEAGELFIRRRLLSHSAANSAISKLLTELHDADLVRIYESGGKRFIHIPRFRQRLRYTNSKYPRPPESYECSEIKKMIGRKSDSSLTQVGPESDLSRLKLREVQRSSSKRGGISREGWQKPTELLSEVIQNKRTPKDSDP